MTAVASQPSFPYAPSNTWEDAIVPALRKRLENESAILTKRLSAHSITLRDDSTAPSRGGSPLAVDFPSSPFKVGSRKERSSGYSRPPSTSPIPRNFSDFHRPSAIPRPSISREPSYAMDTRQLSNYPNGSSKPSSSSGVPSQRNRTQSTPYPFDPQGNENGGQSTPIAVNGMPTPASSRANSPMVSIRPSDRPSRIPTATGKRPRSTSNAASSDSFGRSTLRTPNQVIQKRSKSSIGGARSSDTGHDPNIVSFPPSPETSPDLWSEQERERQKQRAREVWENERRLSALMGEAESILRDEAPPFNPNRMSRASFEEKEFEHWYRGEGREGGGRNGGKGEIKIAKGDTATEMMKIAVGGHKIDHDTNRDTWTSSRRRADSAADRSASRAAREIYQDPEQMDYVPDEQPPLELDGNMTDHSSHRGKEVWSANRDGRNGRGSMGERVSSPSVDGRYSIDVASRKSPVPSVPPIPPSTAPTRHTRSTPPSPARTKSKPPPTQPRTPGKSNTPVTKSNGPSTNPTEARARSQSRPKRPRVSSHTQNNSKSMSPPSRHTPLVDAVPWTQPDQNFGSGNWDDVVLPTVAKKMGLSQGGDNNILEGGFNAKQKKQTDEEVVYEPAPGTFGFDASKIRPRGRPSQFDDRGEFGEEEKVEVKEEEVPPVPQTPPAPAPTSTPINRLEFKYPVRSSSPPPFSNYAAPAPQLTPRHSRVDFNEIPMKPIAVPVVATQPIQPLRQDPRMKPVDDEHEAGCCKCTIM